MAVGHQILFLALHRLPAVPADPSAQPLGEDHEQRRGEQEWALQLLLAPRVRR